MIVLFSITILTVSISEAVNAILSYTFDAQELFRRKKLKKEHLFKYLYGRGVGDVSPSADKNALVKRILKYWGSEETFEVSLEFVEFACHFHDTT